MAGQREVEVLRRGTHPDGRPLTSSDREQLLKPYLPRPHLVQAISPSHGGANGASQPQLPTSKRAHHRSYNLLNLSVLLLHRVLFFVIQFLFSIYIRGRQTYNAILDRIFAILYYHHRTPELIQRDVKKLSRLPKHLSIIVDLTNDGARRGAGAEGLAKLVSDVAEISAWCACAGIPMLSIYERSGTLKSHVPSLHNSILSTFRSYFPPSSLPALHIRAPNHSAYSPPTSRSTSPSPPAPDQRPSLNLLLLSATDGRDTLIDLTKTLAEMSQRGKLHPSDISAELIDAELTEASCGEPDLLVLMAPSAYKTVGARRHSRGRSTHRGRGRAEEPAEEVDTEGVLLGAGGDVCLRGYPPWQVRLAEIFHVQDNSGVGYQVFLRALHKYAKAEMRFGR